MTTGSTQGMAAAAIATAVGGTLVGDGAVVATRVAPLDRAGPTDVSFVATSKYAALFAASAAGIVFVPPGLAELPGPCRTRIIVDNPHEAMLVLLSLLYTAPHCEAGVHPAAVVSPSAQLGANVCIEPFAVVSSGAVLGDRAWIGAHCVIGNGAVIGADVRLYPHVYLYDGVRLGDRVTVHSGSRIGSDGYGYIFRDGAHQKVPQVGGCRIGNDVEIGANCAIDRGSIDDTVLGDGTKVDNLAHIGHNVRIGRLCLVMAQVGIAGSAHIEDGVMLAGQVGVAGHVTIGAGARLAGQAGVISDVPAGETWSGYPARPHKDVLRSAAALLRLPALVKRLERLLTREEE